jgi:hypothetical protein
MEYEEKFGRYVAWIKWDYDGTRGCTGEVYWRKDQFEFEGRIRDKYIIPGCDETDGIGHKFFPDNERRTPMGNTKEKAAIWIHYYISSWNCSLANREKLIKMIDEWKE